MAPAYVGPILKNALSSRMRGLRLDFLIAALMSNQPLALVLDNAVKDQIATQGIGSINLHSLLGIVTGVLQSVGFTGLNPDQVSTMVEGLFDKYIEPIPFPGVPPFLEGTVHKLARQMIRPAITGLFNIFSTPPAPSPVS